MCKVVSVTKIFNQNQQQYNYRKLSTINVRFNKYLQQLQLLKADFYMVSKEEIATNSMQINWGSWMQFQMWNINWR